MNDMTDTSQKAGHISRLGKVLVTSISSGAALVSILSFVRAYGLFGNAPSHLAVGSLGVQWVRVTPEADTAAAIGDTLHLAAFVTDASGTALIGSSIVWSSDDPRVATVNTDGSVIARGAGTTTVVATVGEKLARSRVTVYQKVVAVRVANDSTLTVNDGETLRVVARGIDARGHPVEGRRTLWRSGDTTIAAIDSAGTLAGAKPGATTVLATIDGISTQAPVKVIAAPYALAASAGDAQRAPAGSTLAQPVVVKVLSRRGRPVPGTPVRFRTADGRGATDPSVAVSDGDGLARVTWTLGDLPGRQRLVASVEGLDSLLTITAEADPSAAATRVSVGEGQLRATVNEELPQEVLVRLADTAGRALADVPVSWSVLDGGTITAVAPRTDTLGEARARWKLGPRSGAQRARVQVGSGRTLPPLLVTATAVAGAPAALTVVGGDAQKGTVSDALDRPVTVRVADRGGNPVVGARVVVAPNAGTVEDSVLATDSAGTAKVRWTLGRAAGAQHLVVRVHGLEKPLRVSATARAGRPANVLLAPGGKSDSFHGGTVTATVTDVYGNAVPDAALTFRAKSGTAAPARVATDAKGRAETRWTLKRGAGTQTLTVSIKGSDVTGSLSADPPAATTTKKRTRHD